MRSKDVSVLSKLSDNAKASLKIASEASKLLSANEVAPHHLFVGIVLNSKSLASRTILTMGFDIEKITKEIMGVTGTDFITIEKTKETDIRLSSESQEVLREAYAIAHKLSHVYVGTEHILLALLKADKTELGRKLYTQGLDYKSVEEALFNFATYPAGILSKPENGPSMIMEQSALAAFGRDLVKESREGKLDPIVGREEEIEKMVNIISRRKKNNPLIVGEAGVGKTALVEALAQRIADGNVPQALKDAKIVALDISSIMAGSKMRGDVEEKMIAIIKEVTSSPNTILFIDEIHNVLSSGIPGVPSDMSGILKPALTRGDFRCIGATTMSEYTKYMEEDNALVRRFQAVLVEETSIADTIKILRRIKPILEAHHNVRIGKEALETAVKLSDRYVSDRYLPDKAIDLLDEAAATRKLAVEKEYSQISDLMNELRTTQLEKETDIKKGRMAEALEQKEQEGTLKKKIKQLEKERSISQKSREYEVDITTIRNVVSKWTGIPVATLGSDERSSLINLESTLGRKVVGQEEAVQSVASAIKRARTGISDENRPWASFLFLGPTGVGKTELAKVLTKILFGDEDRLIQIDMSEMMEMHSVSKLIGSPPGYVGYREGGQLTEKIRQQPHSVILFDEIEKAHPDVLNILLQILEYGHLTDGKGRRVNFKNTVIVLTSNIGAEEIRKDKVLGFINETEEKDEEDVENAYQSMKQALTKELRESLRPELLNRLDDIVIFRSLTKEDAQKIVELLITELNIRLKDQGIKVTIDKKVKEYIANEGFSDEYGARPLRRMLQDSVENAIANYLLIHGEEEKGIIKTLKINIKDKEIIVS
ncbi:MAG: ATPase AAA-2 domain protein [candidate division WS6 bacterium GW2011_GWF2_39_15]|uniref:ATPase AAA-2 domain protein n=1 Tax=candidate division WS6 bacterium GW2011_GWF2_39_15 TaxID=1619100 RepID=A0A0G0MTC8_9BACT|nr:MAG: ATPase AAA-2 domain protein [candidate division WS6 bacterium GW2011_GWF2_39_15]